MILLLISKNLIAALLGILVGFFAGYYFNDVFDNDDKMEGI